VNYNSASETSESASSASNTSTRGDYLRSGPKRQRQHGLKGVKKCAPSKRYALGHIYWQIQKEFEEPTYVSACMLNLGERHLIIGCEMGYRYVGSNDWGQELF
jgi:hypothetical protein